MAQRRRAVSALDFLERTAMDAQLSSDKISRLKRKKSRTMGIIPAIPPLANSLKLVAR